MGKWFLAGLLALISLFLIVSRVYPHAANFSPVLALCLMSGFLAQKKPSLLALPALALVVSDALLGFYPGMLFNYLAFGALFFVGTKTSFKFSGFAFSGLFGAVVFFLLSNFGVWYGSQMYTPDLSGLLTCYQMGLPFFRFTLMSTTAFMLIFFGLSSLASHQLREEGLLET